MTSIESVIVLFIGTALWAEYIWELILILRQVKVCKSNTKVPAELEGILDNETFQKARLYSIDKNNYSIFKDLFSTLTNTGTLLFGWSALFWSFGHSTTQYLGLDPTNENIVSIFFIMIINTVMFFVEIPFSVYSTFVLETKHGFNKQTPAFYVKDQIKQFILSQVISIPITSAVIYIVQKGGDMLIIYLWSFTCILIVLMIMIYPSLIAPLFDKYTALPEGNLRNRVYELAGSLKFPLGQLYIVEGSKRSAHNNAYFYGLFGQKRIVLFDTLLENYQPPEKTTETDKDATEKKEEEGGKKKKVGCNDDEVVAVLAHELGHWNHMHIYKNLFIMQLNLLLVFSCFGKLFKFSPLYRALGFAPNVMPIIVGLGSILQLILAPYNAVLSFIMTILSRKYEFEADNFAVKLGHSKKLQSALIKLNIDNLNFPIYDPYYSAWHHSHPPLLERLENLKAKDTDKKTN